jgi:hypothetical protein
MRYFPLLCGGCTAKMRQIALAPQTKLLISLDKKN